MYHVLSQWTDPADTAHNRTWTNRLVAAMAPHARRATHPNHVSSDRQERVRSFYGDETYARLVAVKDRWDPRNVFRHNQNIRPSDRGAGTVA
jgi:FAD/FMN-containing dehydrogenase